MVALWNLLFFIVLIGVLVTVHEYGHFIVARKCGVKVLRFAIGFGKPLFTWHDKQGTEYVIAAIPLGGYVKMLDSRLADIPVEQHLQAFNHKPVGQRIAIVAAGPMFNFVFAIFAFWLMYVIGVASVKPIVGNIEEGSIAELAGVQSGQQIVAINDVKTLNWQTVQLELSSAIGDSDMTIALSSQITDKPTNHQLNLTDWQPKPESESLVESIGIEPFRTEVEPIIAFVADNAPASGKLEKGDRLHAIAGEIITDWYQASELIKQSPEETVLFVIERQHKLIELYIELGVKNDHNANKVGFLGVVPQAKPWPEEYKQLEQYSLVDALPQALYKTWRTIVLSFAMVGKLISGDVSLDALSGPVSIAQGAGATASYGVVYFLSFMAFISVNLGIINLFPLPVLDGGHLLYYLIELVRGKPVPERIQEFGFRIGAFVLFSMMGIAILNDISRL